jgi:hypothetical protein
LNTRKRGPNISKPTRRSKTRPTTASDKQEPRGKESDDDSSGDDAFDRPVRTTVVKGIKREHPGSPRPVPDPPPARREEPPASAYLPLGEREFRILVLAPGRKEDKEVRCSFLTASMSEPPQYEAVSYLWGGNNEAQQTMVDIKLLDSHGKSYSIFTKSNLYNALRSLRHPKDVRKFWVDALCINRSNDVEKNQQIAMKRFIFRNATNLCFWLGEDANSKAALNFVPRILDLTGIDQLVKDDTSIEGWVAFVALLKNTVFSRLWLVQEVAVAQNVTLHCGQPAIHYGDLVDAVAMFVSFRDDISQLFRLNNRNHKDLADRKMRMAERFIDLSTNALRVTPSGIQRLLSLESLVSQLGDFNASDPRDRIFSVLAIAKDGPKLEGETLMEASPLATRREGVLRIDYGRETLDVYQDFVVHAIKRSRSLDLICRHWASSVSEKEANLPTWVRPLQSSLQAPFDSNIAGRTAADSLVGLPDHNYYNASRGKAADFHFEAQPFRSSKSLFAKGLRVDTISKLGPRASEGIILYEWLELGGCVGVGENVPDIFWRTLVADRGPDGSNAPSWYTRAFLYCLHQYPTGDINTNRLIHECERESSLVVDFLQRVQSVIWNRKFLVSQDKGWVGLAPMAAQAGDVICVLYGCSVPVVLRPQSEDGRSFFQLVGECYVHGIMDGEAVETAVASDEEFELQ